MSRRYYPEYVYNNLVRENNRLRKLKEVTAKAVENMEAKTKETKIDTAKAVVDIKTIESYLEILKQQNESILLTFNNINLSLEHLKEENHRLNNRVSNLSKDMETLDNMYQKQNTKLKNVDTNYLEYIKVLDRADLNLKDAILNLNEQIKEVKEVVFKPEPESNIGLSDYVGVSLGVMGLFSISDKLNKILEKTNTNNKKIEKAK